jgi:uncharacterized protein
MCSLAGDRRNFFLLLRCSAAQTLTLTMPALARVQQWLPVLIRSSLSSCAALCLMACGGCAKLQRRVIYFPPAHTSEAVDNATASARLERWYNLQGQAIGWKRLSPQQPAAAQVLILHGNASCAFQCGHFADALQQTGSFDIFIVEYPGYGHRAGAPSEEALYAAAEEGLQSLDGQRPVYIVGESLGAAVAAYLAGKHPGRIAAVALLAPFNRLLDVAQAHVRIFPARWILSERYPSEDYLRNYQGPVAILTAGRDRVVPETFGRRLHDRYSGPKRLWRFPDATHDSVMNLSPAIWQQIVGFWEAHSPGR